RSMRGRSSLVAGWAWFALALLLASSPASAEVGDYSAVQASVNLLFPKKADAPFSPADAADLPIEVRANPRGFRDGFTPGSYYVWQAVALDPSTGAKCGDGSTYNT